MEYEKLFDEIRERLEIIYKSGNVKLKDINDIESAMDKLEKLVK